MSNTQTFQPGDIVRVNRPSVSDHGALATVAEVREYATLWRIRTASIDTGGGKHVALYSHDELELIHRPEPEVIAPHAPGVTVYVTGDDDGWDHDLDNGTAVEILRDDVLIDGSYLVSPTGRGQDAQYVGANDLSVHPPVIELDAYREGDSFPNVGYVRRLLGGEVAA